MPSVFRASYKRRDPKTGRIVVRKYRHWTIKYKDDSGKWRRIKGFTDRAASESHARKLEIKAARLAVGLDDPFEQHLVTPLAEHVEAFEQHLQAKGNCAKYIAYTMCRIKKIVGQQEWNRIGDIAASQVTNYLRDQRDAGAISKRTSNSYLTAIKSFCRWLDEDRRAPHNPLRHLRPIPSEDEPLARNRRAASADEFEKLVKAARNSKIRLIKIPSTDRAMLYMVAAYTGLRAKELASLTKASFNLSEPSVVVEAGYSKRRRRDVQPLRADLTKSLEVWLQPRSASDLLWPGIWYKRAASMIRRDLEAAGIPYTDDRGQTFDFHSLRHTYITLLHRGGTYGKVLQSLARHSTPMLTARYTQVDLSDVAAALSGLPSIPSDQPSDHQSDQGTAICGKNRQSMAKRRRA